MAMKARVANYFRTALYGKDVSELPEAEQKELLAQLGGLIRDMHNELNAYKAKRKDKARIQALRAEKLTDKQE